MSLIKCRECGHKISDNALACPYCGCPIDIASSKEVPLSDPKRRWPVSRILIGVTLLLLIVAGGCGLYWMFGPRKYTLEHQEVGGSTLGNITSLMYVVADCEGTDDRDFDVSKILSDCKAVGYYCGKDSLIHVSQFNRDRIVSLYNNDNRPLCDYVRNNEDEIISFNAYGSFFGLNTDECLLSFRGTVGGEYSEDSGIALKGELKKYGFKDKELYTSLEYVKLDKTTEYTVYYPNGNVKIHKLSDNDSIFVDEYFKVDGSEYTALERMLMSSDTHSCVFKTNLHNMGYKEETVYMFMYADAEDVSKGIVVFVHSKDNLHSIVFDYYYQYEITSTKLTLSHGGYIDIWAAFFHEYKLKPDSRVLSLDINGTSLKGDAPQYNGVANYEYLKDKQPYPSLKQFEQFKHLDIVKLHK